MKNQFRERLSFCATMIEMVVGGLILIGCIISGIGLIGTTSIAELLGDAHYLQDRMSDACLILIGAEMLKMITSYTIDSVVDVMLLAIARQMIVEHTSPQENLLAVLSVGVLFVIRKFLYISRLDKRRELERKKKEDKQKGSAPSLAAENAEASAAEPLQSDEMRKRDEFHIDEEPGRAGTAQGRRRAQGGGRTPPHRADGEERYPLKLYVKTPCMDGKCHAGGSFIF